MPLLSREEFVKLCTNAILYTREKITVGNQKSGYIKYHQEIKENNYFSANVRTPLTNAVNDEFTYRHDLIEHVGMGNCHELADFLLVEIGKAIHLKYAVAGMRVVSSIKSDHVYLEIRIKLKDENGYSLWEVDAWDPRIIDISTRPNGSIKNHESLDYGYSTDTINSVHTDEINYKHRYIFFKEIPKPVPRSPRGNATPERDVLSKHDKLYRDYSIEDSVEQEKLDFDGTIHYLQQVSGWQLR